MSGCKNLAILFAVILLGQGKPAAGKPPVCLLAGLSPGDRIESVVHKLGRADEQETYPSEDPAFPGQSTRSRWRRAGSRVEVEASSKGEVLKIAATVLRGTVPAPFGVRLGRDSLRKVVDRSIGKRFITVNPAVCANGEITVTVSASCGPEGSTTVEFSSRARLHDSLKPLCGQTVELASLERTAGRWVVTSATLSY